jgi:hypothetical protein
MSVSIPGQVCRDCPATPDRFPRAPMCPGDGGGARFGDRLECCMARWQAPMSRQERRAFQRELDKRMGVP